MMVKLLVLEMEKREGVGEGDDGSDGVLVVVGLPAWWRWWWCQILEREKLE